MTRGPSFVLLLGLMLALGGCGQRGPLKPPLPRPATSSAAQPHLAHPVCMPCRSLES